MFVCVVLVVKAVSYLILLRQAECVLRQLDQSQQVPYSNLMYAVGRRFPGVRHDVQAVASFRPVHADRCTNGVRPVTVHDCQFMSLCCSSSYTHVERGWVGLTNRPLTLLPSWHANA